MIKAVLFDLDGTLLPMDTQRFTEGYFKALAEALCPLGVTPEALTGAVWKGTEAMVHHGGALRNEARFWQVFCQALGLDEQQAHAFRRASDAFYSGGFHAVRPLTGENPLAVEACAWPGRAGGRWRWPPIRFFPWRGSGPA